MTSTSDYTKKALKDLRDQLQADADNDFNNDGENSDSDLDQDDNLIIQNFRDKSIINNANATATATATANASMNVGANNNANSASKNKPIIINNQHDIVSTLLAQHELDRNKLTKLTKKLYRSEMDTEKQEMKLHYLKLDLSNSTVSVEELNQKILNKDKEIVVLKQSLGIYLISIISSLFLNFIILMLSRSN